MLLHLLCRSIFHILATVAFIHRRDKLDAYELVTVNRNLLNRQAGCIVGQSESLPMTTPTCGAREALVSLVIR